MSLDEKVISPDKRFKVRRLSPLKWVLSIENVADSDSEVYFLCQVSKPVNSDVEVSCAECWEVETSRERLKSD